MFKYLLKHSNEYWVTTDRRENEETTIWNKQLLIYSKEKNRSRQEFSMIIAVYGYSSTKLKHQIK